MSIYLIHFVFAQWIKSTTLQGFTKNLIAPYRVITFGKGMPLPASDALSGTLRFSVISLFNYSF